MADRHARLTLAPWVVPGRPGAHRGRPGRTTLAEVAR